MTRAGHRFCVRSPRSRSSSGDRQVPLRSWSLPGGCRRTISAAPASSARNHPLQAGCSGHGPRRSANCPPPAGPTRYCASPVRPALANRARSSWSGSRNRSSRTQTPSRRPRLPANSRFPPRTANPMRSSDAGDLSPERTVSATNRKGGCPPAVETASAWLYEAPAGCLPGASRRLHGECRRPTHADAVAT